MFSTLIALGYSVWAGLILGLLIIVVNWGFTYNQWKRDSGNPAISFVELCVGQIMNVL